MIRDRSKLDMQPVDRRTPWLLIVFIALGVVGLLAPELAQAIR